MKAGYGISIQEPIHGFAHGYSDYAPYASYNEFAKYEAEEERYSLTMHFDAAGFQDNPLRKTTKHYGKPEDVHGPTAGNSVSGRMKRPPEEFHPHEHQQERRSKSHIRGDNGAIIRWLRRREKALQPVERLPCEPCWSAYIIGYVEVCPEGCQSGYRNGYCHRDQESPGVHIRPFGQFESLQLMRHGMSSIGPVEEIKIGEHC